MEYVEKLKGKQIQIVTSDNRVFNGSLFCCDNNLNCTLLNTVEVVSIDNERNFEKMGTYLIRGDNVVTINEVK